MSLRPPESTAWLEEIDAFISGEMNEREAIRFKERLRRDERARLIYVEYLDLHFELLQSAGRLAAHDPASSLNDRSRLALWLSAASVAAALVIAVSAISLWRRPAPTIAAVPAPIVEAPLPVVEPPRVELPVVAHLGATFDASWTDSTLSLQPGSILREGDVLDLYRGVAEIHFKSGVRCYLAAEEGVTAFLRVDSALGCTIESGQATFDVPQAAKGFAVVTSGGRFVDLGTEFGVSVDPRGPSQVHVLEGRVEVHGANDSRLLLDRGAAARLAGTGSIPAAIPFNPDVIARPAALSRGLDALSDKIRLHLVAPPSLRPGGTVTDDSTHLVMERRQTSLPAEWSNSTRSVRETRPEGVQEVTGFVCGAGRRVDSYLVHATPTPGKKRREMSGRITFRRPILAVITTDDDLRTSRELFGDEDTDYPHPVGIGLETTATLQPDDKVDEVILSDDRRTLSFTLNMGPVFDQFRVLVASEDEAVAESKVVQGKSP